MRDPRRRPNTRTTRSVLDQLVYRFQHRWETEPQFRATLSGVLGLGAILALCSCLLIVSTFANAALAGGNSTQSTVLGRGTPNTGVGTVGAVKLFPTPTYPLPPSNAIPPESPIPDSQTPPPGPTVTPTVAPTATSFTNPGGPTFPTTCSGTVTSGGTATWAFNPCPLVHGQGGTLTVTQHGHAGAPINIVLSFGSCPGGVSCGFVYPPDQGYHLDGSGSITVSFTVPAQVQIGAAPVSGLIAITGGASGGYTAAPVQ